MVLVGVYHQSVSPVRIINATLGVPISVCDAVLPEAVPLFTAVIPWPLVKVKLATRPGESLLGNTCQKGWNANANAPKIPVPNADGASRLVPPVV